MAGVRLDLWLGLYLVPHRVSEDHLLVFGCPVSLHLPTLLVTVAERGRGYTTKGLRQSLPWDILAQNKPSRWALEMESPVRMSTVCTKLDGQGD